jgi:predicted protein tyrosine phosphatase
VLLFCLTSFSKRFFCSSANLDPEGFEYLKLGLLDDADQRGEVLGGGDRNKFFKIEETAFSFIDRARDANGKCLVHCLHGKSRSAFIVIAYGSVANFAKRRGKLTVLPLRYVGI